MIKVAHSFHNGKGDAYLIQDGAMYAVSLTFITLPGAYRCEVLGDLTYIDARAKYDAHVAMLGGASRCAFYAGRPRCTAVNCPKDFGGAAFWEIFENSCPHKTR